ncbi:MAG: T9SS C-terminal target domain-containing protein [Bacteroidetes bacterium]|nr:MAG: T9SS C-terminal target domain-containing protein [Bacteroidota bacterium]
MKTNVPFAEPNPDIYDNAEPFPQKLIRVLHHDWFDGDKHIVTMAVNPVRYYPKENKIILYTDIQYELVFSSGSKGAIQVQSRSGKHAFMYNELLKEMVDNPEEVPEPMSSSTLYKASSGPLPFYEYVIITPNIFKSSFLRLLDWKKRKGLDAGIVTLEDILANYSTDYTSGITDDAGAIRQYLQDGYISGATVFALLGGDYNYMPIRYGCGSNNTWGMWIDGIWVPDGNKIPADLYFCDLNGDWDVDGDVFTGEEDNDTPDYAPEIFVGRLLCSSTQDIERWTDKLILYEQDPGRGNSSYLVNSFMIESDQMQHGNQAEFVKAHLPDALKSATIIWREQPSYDSDPATSPYAYQVINEFNNTKYGLFSWFGHGTPISVNAKSDGINDSNQSQIYPFDSDDLGAENGNGLDNLTNYDFPAICYSISCYPTPFDHFNINGWWNYNYNLGAGFTVATKAGGPSFLGNTRVGYVSSSYLLYKEFAELISSGGNNLHIGISEALSKQNNTADKHFLSYSHNLVGCPETKIWTEIPSSFTAVSVTDNGTSLTVNPGVSGCDITVMSIDGGDSYQLCAHNVSSYTFTTSLRPLYVTITKDNYLPYVAITGGHISSNKEFYGNLIILDNLIIDNTASLNIKENSVLKFNENTYLNVYGSINVEGSNFTSAKTNPLTGDWNGIRVFGQANLNNCVIEYGMPGIRFYESSSGTIDNCELRYNTYGAYIYKSTPTIKNSHIHNNSSKGIYCYYENLASGQAQILNNKIHDNGTGIDLYKSSPDIRDNEIYNESYAIDCYNNASPYLGEYEIKGNNNIHDVTYAIEAVNSSNPFLGEEDCFIDGGYNSIIGNNYHIWAETDCYVKAENNWWGASTPSSNKFSSHDGSTIDYVPYLSSKPFNVNNSNFPEEKEFNAVLAKTFSSNNDFMSYYNENWPIKQKLLFARDIIYLDGIKEAEDICKEIIENYPDSSLSYFALDILWEASRQENTPEEYDLEAFDNYLKTLSDSKEKKEFYGYVKLMQSVFENDKTLNTCNDVYGNYNSKYLDCLSLFEQFIYYLYEKNDIKSAEEILIQMEADFHNYTMTQKAKREWDGTSKYLTKENKAQQKNSDNVSDIPKTFVLKQNYPNPFNNSTTITYHISKPAWISILIFNCNGKLIKSFNKMHNRAGEYSIIWHGDNINNRSVSSGIYYLQLNFKELESKEILNKKTIKLIFLK